MSWAEREEEPDEGREDRPEERWDARSEDRWDHRSEDRWDHRSEDRWDHRSEDRWDDRSDEPSEEQSDEGWPDEPPVRWPLTWHGLYPHERWLWFQQLWADVCMLRMRYRLSVRSGWWEDQVQVEALAALASWAARYDSGEWDDPPGKLALLYDLDRVRELLRDGLDPFHPERDRYAFSAYLIEIGCRPAPE